MDSCPIEYFGSCYDAMTRLPILYLQNDRLWRRKCDVVNDSGYVHQVSRVFTTRDDPLIPPDHFTFIFQISEDDFIYAYNYCIDSHRQFRDADRNGSFVELTRIAYLRSKRREVELAFNNNSRCYVARLPGKFRKIRVPRCMLEGVPEVRMDERYDDYRDDRLVDEDLPVLEYDEQQPRRYRSSERSVRSSGRSVDRGRSMDRSPELSVRSLGRPERTDHTRRDRNVDKFGYICNIGPIERERVRRSSTSYFNCDLQINDRDYMPCIIYDTQLREDFLDWDQEDRFVAFRDIRIVRREDQDWIEYYRDSRVEVMADFGDFDKIDHHSGGDEGDIYAPVGYSDEKYEESADFEYHDGGDRNYVESGDERTIGYIHNLSSMQFTRDNRRYFHCQLQTGNNEFVKVFVYWTQVRPKFYAFFKTGKRVKLSNIKFATLRDGYVSIRFHRQSVIEEAADDGDFGRREDHENENLLTVEEQNSVGIIERVSKLQSDPRKFRNGRKFFNCDLRVSDDVVVTVESFNPRELPKFRALERQRQRVKFEDIVYWRSADGGIDIIHYMYSSKITVLSESGSAYREDSYVDDEGTERGWESSRDGRQYRGDSRDVGGYEEEEEEAAEYNDRNRDNDERHFQEEFQDEEGYPVDDFEDFPLDEYQENDEGHYDHQNDRYDDRNNRDTYDDGRGGYERGTEEYSDRGRRAASDRGYRDGDRYEERGQGRRGDDDYNDESIPVKHGRYEDSYDDNEYRASDQRSRRDASQSYRDDRGGYRDERDQRFWRGDSRNRCRDEEDNYGEEAYLREEDGYDDEEGYPVDDFETDEMEYDRPADSEWPSDEGYDDRNQNYEEEYDDRRDRYENDDYVDDGLIPIEDDDEIEFDEFRPEMGVGTRDGYPRNDAPARDVRADSRQVARRDVANDGRTGSLPRQERFVGRDDRSSSSGRVVRRDPVRPPPRDDFRGQGAGGEGRYPVRCEDRGRNSNSTFDDARSRSTSSSRTRAVQARTNMAPRSMEGRIIEVDYDRRSTVVDASRDRQPYDRSETRVGQRRSPLQSNRTTGSRAAPVSDSRSSATRTNAARSVILNKPGGGRLAPPSRRVESSEDVGTNVVVHRCSGGESRALSVDARSVGKGQTVGDLSSRSSVAGNDKARSVENRSREVCRDTRREVILCTEKSVSRAKGDVSAKSSAAVGTKGTASTGSRIIPTSTTKRQTNSSTEADDGKMKDKKRAGAPVSGHSGPAESVKNKDAKPAQTAKIPSVSPQSRLQGKRIANLRKAVAGEDRAAAAKSKLGGQVDDAGKAVAKVAAIASRVQTTKATVPQLSSTPDSKAAGKLPAKQKPAAKKDGGAKSDDKVKKEGSSVAASVSKETKLSVPMTTETQMDSISGYIMNIGKVKFPRDRAHDPVFNCHLQCGKTEIVRCTIFGSAKYQKFKEIDERNLFVKMEYIKYFNSNNNDPDELHFLMSSKITVSPAPMYDKKSDLVGKLDPTMEYKPDDDKSDEPDRAVKTEPPRDLGRGRPPDVREDRSYYRRDDRRNRPALSSRSDENRSFSRHDGRSDRVSSKSSASGYDDRKDCVVSKHESVDRAKLVDKSEFSSLETKKGYIHRVGPLKQPTNPRNDLFFYCELEYAKAEFMHVVAFKADAHDEFIDYADNHKFVLLNRVKITESPRGGRAHKQQVLFFKNSEAVALSGPRPFTKSASVMDPDDDLKEDSVEEKRKNIQMRDFKPVVKSIEDSVEEKRKNIQMRDFKPVVKSIESKTDSVDKKARPKLDKEPKGYIHKVGPVREPDDPERSPYFYCEVQTSEKDFNLVLVFNVAERDRFMDVEKDNRFVRLEQVSIHERGFGEMIYFNKDSRMTVLRPSAAGFDKKLLASQIRSESDKRARSQDRSERRGSRERRDRSRTPQKRRDYGTRSPDGRRDGGRSAEPRRDDGRSSDRLRDRDRVSPNRRQDNRSRSPQKRDDRNDRRRVDHRRIPENRCGPRNRTPDRRRGERSRSGDRRRDDRTRTPDRHRDDRSVEKRRPDLVRRKEDRDDTDPRADFDAYIHCVGPLEHVAGRSDNPENRYFYCDLQVADQEFVRCMVSDKNLHPQFIQADFHNSFTRLENVRLRHKDCGDVVHVLPYSVFKIFEDYHKPPFSRSKHHVQLSTPNTGASKKRKSRSRSPIDRSSKYSRTQGTNRSPSPRRHSERTQGTNRSPSPRRHSASYTSHPAPKSKLDEFEAMMSVVENPNVVYQPPDSLARIRSAYSDSSGQTHSYGYQQHQQKSSSIYDYQPSVHGQYMPQSGSLSIPMSLPSSSATTAVPAYQSLGRPTAMTRPGAMLQRHPVPQQHHHPAGIPRQQVRNPASTSSYPSEFDRIWSQLTKP